MGLERQGKRVMQLRAIRMAQWRLKQRLETIDYMEDVLRLEVDKLKDGQPVMGLDAATAFDVKVVNTRANSDHPKATDDAGRPDHQADGDPAGGQTAEDS